MAEKLALKWNNFHSNASNSFTSLRNEEYLQDVTLVTDDYHHVSAHKLVLSACSEYFKNIFKKCKHQHPMLCLDGVHYKDLVNALDYVYNGEVQIFQEELDHFLLVARRLKLEGLLSSEDGSSSEMYEAREQKTQDRHNVSNDAQNCKFVQEPKMNKRKVQPVEKINISMDNTELELKRLEEKFEPENERFREPMPIQKHSNVRIQDLTSKDNDTGVSNKTKPTISTSRCCHLCGASFSTAVKMAQHIYCCHPKDNYKFECSVCLGMGSLSNILIN